MFMNMYNITFNITFKNRKKKLLPKLDDLEKTIKSSSFTSCSDSECSIEEIQNNNNTHLRRGNNNLQNKIRKLEKTIKKLEKNSY